MAENVLHINPAQVSPIPLVLYLAGNENPNQPSNLAVLKGFLTLKKKKHMSSRRFTTVEDGLTKLGYLVRDHHPGVWFVEYLAITNQLESHPQQQQQQQASP